MVIYEFMNEVMPEKKMLSNSQHNEMLESSEINIEKIRAIISQSLQSGTVGKAYLKIRNICSQLDDEKGLKTACSNVVNLIPNPEIYYDDMVTDIYMGLLWNDKNYSFTPTDKMKEAWENEACHMSIDMDAVRKQYPQVEGKDILENEIRGGCQAYHELMMSQSNLGIFNFTDEVESIQRYAFPKTHDIYWKLKDAPIENMILFEKTMGMGYTNQIFHYMKDIADIETFQSIQEIIYISAELAPFFLRKKLMGIIWPYLEQSSFDKDCIKRVEDILEDTLQIFQSVYTDVLRFCWKIHYSSYSNHGREKRNDILYILKCHIIQQWERYYNEEEVYQNYLKEENLHDWRDIDKLGDCFFKVKFKEDEEGSASSPYQQLLHTDRISLKTIDDEHREIIGGMPKNEIGEYVKKMAISEMEKKWNLPVNQEKLADIYYRERKSAFEQLKREEQKKWGKQDPKLSAKKLKQIHVYAMIHKEIVEALNLNG